jgi:hypothetical protein
MSSQQVTVEVTSEEMSRLEARAKAEGFERIEDYLRALIEADIEDDEGDPVEDLRLALRDLKAGRVRPISELRAAVENGE